jgi:hypothetical protein
MGFVLLAEVCPWFDKIAFGLTRTLPSLKPEAVFLVVFDPSMNEL